MNVLIVGAGLFGQMAAKACVQAGHQVTMFDCGKYEAASPASACLLKPSWFAGLGEIGKEGYKVLEELYTVQKIGFNILGKKVEINWVDPFQILQSPNVPDKVLEVGDGTIKTVHDSWTGKVLVAAGVWSFDLFPQIKEQMKHLTGCSLTFKGECEPKISVYAPYKQAIRFVREPGFSWFGDGTKILRENYGQYYIDKTIERAEKHDLRNPIATIVGMRPYVKNYPTGFFQQVYPNTWVSTGGAKNGTILAAYYAKRFVEALK